jgi:hypothetical protein
MGRTLNIVGALRVAGLWLLLVSVFASPFGLGASAASAGKKACGVSCPCAEAEQAQEEAHSDDCCGNRQKAASPDETPCDDACPDDCTDCKCCPGLMVGLIPIVIAAGLPDTLPSSKLLPPLDVPANGYDSGIFRPPRSLS